MCDVLRTCYRAKMKFFNDSDKLTTVDWFFTENTDTIPFSHNFASRVYREEWELDPDLGEQNEPRTWLSGAAPCPCPKKGFCGSQGQWVNGSSLGDPLPALWPRTNVNKCCEEPPPCADGGVVMGGPKVERIPPPPEILTAGPCCWASCGCCFGVEYA